jgi:hypothetical protein
MFRNMLVHLQGLNYLLLLLFNTVYIKNNPTCFEPCHSSSSGTQLFITIIIICYLIHKASDTVTTISTQLPTFYLLTYIY